VTNPTLQVSELTKRFGSGVTQVTAVRQVSLSIEPGEVVLIMGPSGSGKTTLLSMMGALLRPTSGSIHLDGTAISELSEGKLPAIRLRQFGFIFQDFNLLSALTIRENVSLVAELSGTKRRAAREKATAILTELGLGARLDFLPDKLSGGEKQRVAIARALAMEPKVLLFDEPTSALDPSLVGEVLNVMEELAHEGTTMIVVTHEMDFAREAADRVLFMEEGVFIEEGPPEQVLDSPKNPLTQVFLERFLTEGRIRRTRPGEEAPAPLPPPIGHTV